MSPFTWYRFYITLQWLINYALTTLPSSPHHLATNNQHRRSQPSRNAVTSAAVAIFQFSSRSISHQPATQPVRNQRRVACTSLGLQIIIGSSSCHGQNRFSLQAVQLLSLPSPLTLAINECLIVGQKRPVQIHYHANAINSASPVSPRGVAQSPQCDCIQEPNPNPNQLLPKCSIATSAVPKCADPSPATFRLVAKESVAQLFHLPQENLGRLQHNNVDHYQPHKLVLLPFHPCRPSSSLPPGTATMSSSSKPGLNPNAPSFKVGKSPGSVKSQSRLNFSAAAKQKAAVVSIEKKVVNTKIGRARALSNSSAVKKVKGSDGAISKPHLSLLNPPSPVNAAVRGSTSKSNKRVQITSPPREPTSGDSGSPVSPPRAKNLSKSWAAALKSSAPAPTKSPIEAKKPTAKTTLERSKIDLTSESSESEDSSVLEVYSDFRKAKAPTTSTSGGVFSDSSVDSAPSIKKTTNTTVDDKSDISSVEDSILKPVLPKNSYSTAKHEDDDETPDPALFSKEDNRSLSSVGSWEDMMDSEDEEIPKSEPKSGNISKLTSLGSDKKPTGLFNQSIAQLGEKQESVSAKDYAFLESSNLTQQFRDVFPDLQTLLFDTWLSSPSKLHHPSSNPYQVDISEDTGAFWLVNSLGTPVVAIPDELASKVDDLPPPETKPADLNRSSTIEKQPVKLPTTPARERRQIRRQLLSNKAHTLFPSARDLNDSLAQLWKGDISKVWTSFLEKFYPKSVVQQESNAGEQGLGWCAILTNYENGKPLIATSYKNHEDAEDRLFGFLMQKHVGIPVRHAINLDSYSVPMHFKSYYPVSNPAACPKYDDDSSDSDMDTSSDSTDSLDIRRKRWWLDVSSGGGCITDFSPRLKCIPEGKLMYYDLDWWEKNATSSSIKHYWPKPDLLKQKEDVYMMVIKQWGPNDESLVSSSSFSFVDAALRAIYYSKFVQDGLGGDMQLCNEPEIGPFFQVPLDFCYYPEDISRRDPEMALSALFDQPMLCNPEVEENARFRTMGLYVPPGSSAPEPQGRTITPKSDSPSVQVKLPKSNLKTSSYSQAPVTLTRTQSIFQRLLSEEATPFDGPARTSSDSTFLATANLAPEPGIHPVETVIDKMRIILTAGRDIDPSFSIYPVHLNMKEDFPPLVSVDRNFPSCHSEMVHYALVPNPWQLVQVREGQKTRDGKEKKQGFIYVTLRLHSQFDTALILNYLLPELDTRNIRLNVKGVQIPDTETRMVLFGVSPDSCPEGIKQMVKAVYKVELKAAARKGSITKTEAGSADLDDIYFRARMGIRTLKLTSPDHQSRFGVEGFNADLRTCIGIETPMKRTATHAHLLNSATTSQSIRAILGSRATVVHTPGNGAISQPNVVKWMQKVRAQMAIVYHSESLYLKGVMDILRDVRVAWRDNSRDKSPWQHKTVNINRLLRSLTLEDGTHVFSGLCPCLTGPNIGSTLATSLRRPEITKFVGKIAPSPVAWIYWYCYERLLFSSDCIDLILKGCDSEEVLLVTETDWNDDSMTVTTPFSNAGDDFIQSVDDNGLVLDISAMTDEARAALSPEAPTNPQESDYARRLRLKDDASFTTRNSDAVSRVSSATANTSGAASFRSNTTTDNNRDFRDQCLERARLRASQAAASMTGGNQSSQGGPASNGAASAAHQASSTADLPGDKTGGGAPA